MVHIRGIRTWSTNRERGITAAAGKQGPPETVGSHRTGELKTGLSTRNCCEAASFRWHSVQHLKECADDVFGKDTERGRKWFDKHRKILLDDARGIGRTIDAIRHLVRTNRGGKVLRRELEFFRKNRARMDYRGAKDAGCPIGSGCVESANRFLVQQRMKRSGQRWGREGGQGVLTFRSLLKSGRFDAACRAMVRRRRAKLPARLPAPAPKLAFAA